MNVSELTALEMVIHSELPLQHWRVDKSGKDALEQVLKWIRKIRCREVIPTPNGDILVTRPDPTYSS